MKKVFALLLVLAMVFILLPAPESSAIMSGEPCPMCRDVECVFEWFDPDSHFFYCDEGFTGTASHYGGTATCTQKAVCAACGEEYGEYAHDWGPWVDQDDGTHKRICKNNCGASETQAHSWSGWYEYGDQHRRHCLADCGASEVRNHKWSEWEKENETQHSRCCIAGDDKCGVIRYAPHTGGTATCTQKAVCEVCHEEYGELGHIPGEPTQENVVPATCRQSERYDLVTYCLACGDEISREHVTVGDPDPDAHSWDADWTWDEDAHWHKCINEGCTARRDQADHTAVTVEAIAPTCTEWGHSEYEYCSVCQAPLTEQIDLEPLDHSWDTDWTSDGQTHWHKCLNAGCNERKDEAAHAGGEAACTSGPLCETCQTEYAPDTALGHDIVHHAAQAETCTAVGWNAYDTCSRCDYSTYAEIAALGHDLVHHEAQAATCTAVGWNAYDTCSRCDYSTYAEIAALGHDLVHHEAQAPTRTEVGWERL